MTVEQYDRFLAVLEGLESLATFLVIVYAFVVVARIVVNGKV